jgi:hypothetical protein
MFDKDTKHQEVSTQDFLNTVRKVMRYNFIDNYTIIKAKGHYKSDTMTVCEPTVIVEIIINYELFTDDIKHMLCDFLNQESVLITKQKLEVL